MEYHVSTLESGTKNHIRPGTSGIIAKRVTYYGSECVSGAAPANGVNALYVAQTAMNEVNALRECFPEKEFVRNHAIITEGGQNVLFLPSKVVVEAHVRAYDYHVLRDVNQKINRAYAAAAMAFGALVEIEDLEMYLPENDCDNPELSRIAYEVGCDLFGEENVTMDLNPFARSCGGTDMGNIGAVMPCIQPISHGDFGGAHTCNYEVKYPEFAVFHTAVVQAAIACVLLEKEAVRAKQIIADYKPIFTSAAEYCEAVDKILGVKKPVKYNEDGSAGIAGG